MEVVAHPVMAQQESMALPEGLQVEELANGVRVGGWRIETAARRGILKAHDMERVEERVGNAHLPEMIHGHNALQCTHEATGTCLRFDALHGLRGWVEEAAPPLEVADAARWKRTHDLQGVPVVQYDWTYTSCYRGTLLRPPATPTGLGLDAALALSADEGVEEAAAAGADGWTETAERLDRTKLAVPEPILFFDEVDLYESELDDNGVARMSVKVRVMPSGWYALLRFWLRVDGVLMRLRDTRFHCPFDPPAASAPYVLREICDREDSLAPGKGVRLPPAALSDPNIAEKMLTARNERTEMLLL